MYDSLPICNPHQLSRFINPRIFQLRDGGGDMEMISIHSINYTSLKDLMPESPPSTPPPPPFCRADCWREIPMKDPLLQHAAWAYLQPMMAERRSEDYRWWRRFHHRFCCLIDCFNGVVFIVSKQVRERLMIKI